ncbi:MAG: SPOR domain-containing protein [Bacteroidia bacterium]
MRQNHSCSIAGFGDFQVHAVSSQVDPIAQLIHPMNLELVFTEGSNISSSNFIDFCAHVWQMNFADAKSKIDQQVKEAHLYLSNEGSFSIENLGIFTKTAQSGIHFKLDAENWTSGISFGLPDLRFQAAANKVKTITVDRTAQPGDMEEISLAREQALKELRQMLDQANIAESGKTNKKIGAFPIIATVLTVILLINVILFLKKNPTSAIQSEIAKMDMASETGSLIKDSVEPVGKSNLVEVQVESKDKIFNPGFAIRKAEFDFDSNQYFPIINLNVIPDINSVNEQLKEESSIDETTPEVTEPLVIEQASPIVKNNNSAPVISKITENNTNKIGAYSLVAGAFKSQVNARKLERELKAQGFKNAQVLKPKNHIYFLVFYESFSNRADAMKKQAQLEVNGEEPWIFEAE